MFPTSSERIQSFSSLATEADVSLWNPGLLSGLVMAGANQESVADSILHAAEIEALSLPAMELVVLSTCESAVGASTAAEGMSGFQRAFHIAGARTVLSSLWEIDDAATVELMKKFYTYLWIKKMSRIEAIRSTTPKN